MTGDWQRLGIRMVWLDLIKVVLSGIPGYLGVVTFNDDGPVSRGGRDESRASDGGKDPKWVSEPVSC